MGTREHATRVSRAAAVHARRDGGDGVGDRASRALDALARQAVPHGRVRARDERGPDRPRRGDDPARLRVDEVVPGLHRPAGPACSRARVRDGDPAPARDRLRRSLGRDGSRRCGPRLHVRVRADLDRAAAAPHGRPPAPRRAGAGMRIEIVSGIWPPDVGGPATHAPELADWLRARGHAVEAFVTADAPPAVEAYPVRWVSRRLPVGVRHAEVVRRLSGRARRADVVYGTSMLGRSAAAALVAGSPLVLKVTSDPAFERARRRGAVGGAVVDFQHGHGSALIRALRVSRDATVRRAAHVVCPSTYMAELVVSWGVPQDRVTVLPNPAPRPDEAAAVELGDRPAVVFAGRLTAAKDLGVLLRALAEVPEATLTVVGDGAERSSLQALAAELRLGQRVRFLGPRPRPEVLGLMAAADAVVLSSAWENFPHGLVEALAMGTPVVATRVGGVPEIVEEGANGLLVGAGDPHAFAAALSRLLDDSELRARLRAAAAGSVARFEQDAVYGRLEQILAAAAS